MQASKKSYGTHNHMKGQLLSQMLINCHCCLDNLGTQHNQNSIMEMERRSITKQTFETCAGTLHEEVMLATQSDPCLVFWPSLFTEHTIFNEVSEGLGQDFPNIPQVLLDPPGHGKSCFNGKKLSFGDCARAVCEILDQLKFNTCIFIGCVWGGLVGIHFAATYPTRVMHMVSSNSWLTYTY